MESLKRPLDLDVVVYVNILRGEGWERLINLGLPSRYQLIRHLETSDVFPAVETL